MTASRRDALVLGSCMAGAAALAALARPAQKATAAPPPVDLEALFPHAFGPWRENDAGRSFVRPPELQGKIYGLYDQLLERMFVGEEGQRVMLSAAYGADQSSRFQLHRPEGCYEGAGFEVRDIAVDALPLTDRRLSVTRLLAYKPDRPEPVTYWTVLDGDLVSGRFDFRLKRVLSGFGSRALAGLLVRISSIDTHTARAHALHTRFVGAIDRALEPSARQAVFGRLG